MLTIPDTVKALFKQDGVRKNFRVHFPNGELPDITNDNIVQESVKFSESLCSQDVLKFGLTEASTIEFETVGISNMFGMTIECGIEIDLSSLSAADISAIESAPGDGAFISLADSDIGYAFYRVPYGVFYVNNCPRDHQAMTHRKVTAFSNLSTTKSWKQATDALLSSPADLATPTVYAPNIDALALSALYSANPDALLDLGYTKQTLSYPKASSGGSPQYYSLANPPVRRFNYKDSAGNSKVVFIALYYRTVSVTTAIISDAIQKNNIAAFFPKLQDKDAILQAYHGIMPTLDLEQSGYASWEEVDEALWAEITRYINPTNCYGDLVYWYNNDHAILSNEDSAYYFYRADKDGIFLNFLTGVGYYTPNTQQQQYVGTKLISFDTGTFAVYTPPVSPSEFLGFDLSFAPTGQAWNGSYGAYRNIYYGAYKIADILNAYLEIHAEFGKESRTGGIHPFRLSNTSPVSIIPAEYSSAWWDEYYVYPIGAVNFPINENEIGSYAFGGYSSVYDMTDNAVLKSSGITQAAIQTLLDNAFIPYLDAVQYTPIELDAIGLPYLEAGDAIQLTAEDGTVVDSYIMTHEITGIQVLSATITSQGGTIIESEVS